MERNLFALIGRKKFLKICSALMAFLFTFTSLSFSQPAEAHIPTAPSVFLIQEAHVNYGSQKNIAAALASINRERNFPESVIALEGTSFGSNIDPAVFRAFPVDEIKRDVSKSFLKQGKIDGAEYFAINNAPNAILTGIEDGKLYRENLAAFRNFYPNQNQCLEAIRKIRNSVEKIKNQVYSKPMLDFEKSRKRTAQDGSSLYLHLILLAQSAKLKQISMDQYPTIERLILGIKRFHALTSKEAQALISRENNITLFEELASLEHTLRTLLPRGIDEKTLAQSDRYLELLEKLASISITREEYEELKKIRENWESLDDLLIRRGENISSREIIGRIQPLMKSVFQFYELAEKRDSALSINALRLIKKQNRKTIYVITGGFHTAGIAKALQKKNISYVSLAPQPELNPNPSEYFTQLDGKNLTLEEMLKTETSALRPERKNYSLEALLVQAGAVGYYNVPDAAGTLRQFKDNLVARKSLDRKKHSILDQILRQSGKTSFQLQIDGKPITIKINRHVSANSLGQGKKDKDKEPVFEIDLDDLLAKSGTKPGPKNGVTTPPANAPDMPYSDYFALKLQESSRFRNIKLVGKGGMAYVYKAEQITPQGIRTVAIKTPQPDMITRPEEMARFELEAKAVIRAQTQSSVTEDYGIKLYEFGNLEMDPYNPAPYLVMEFLEDATTIDDLCKLHPNGIPLVLAVKIIRRAALAMEHFHKHRIIHRDIKPSNIGLQRVEKKDRERLRPIRIDSGKISGNYIPKILDFGLVKRVKGSTSADGKKSLTKTGDIIGTPSFMSPEQALDSKTVDCRTDIYSLASTLFYMITGKYPIEDNNALSLLAKLVDEPQRRQTLNASFETLSKLDLSDKRLHELKSIFLTAMADRDNRYQTAEAFAKDLERFLKNLAREESISSSSSEIIPVERTLVKSKKILVAAAITAALSAGAVTAVVLYFTANRPPEKAQGRSLGMNSSVNQMEALKALAYQMKQANGHAAHNALTLLKLIHDSIPNPAALQDKYFAYFEWATAANGAPAQMYQEWWPRQPDPQAVRLLPSLNGNGTSYSLSIPSLNSNVRVTLYARSTPSAQIPVVAPQPAPAAKPATFLDLFAQKLEATGRYSDVKFIAKGGMAYVFKATEKTSDGERIVAIKTMQEQELRDVEGKKRFKKEGRVLQKIQEKDSFLRTHVIPFFEMGEVEIPQHGAVPYYAMEFLDEAKSLDDLLKESPEEEIQTPNNPPQKLHRVPAALAVKLIHRIALAMDDFHNDGYIHRDIKPANIGLKRVKKSEAKTLKPFPIHMGSMNGEYIPILMDLGLAKDSNHGVNSLSLRSLTQEGEVLGTPVFMSPEQACDSKKADKRADVYALAASLFALIAGRVPIPWDQKKEPQFFNFGYKLMDDTLRSKALEESLLLLDSLDISDSQKENLKAIFRKAIAYPLADRYQTAKAFAKELERFIQKQAKEEMMAPSESGLKSKSASAASRSIELSAVREGAAPARAKRWLRAKRGLILAAGIISAFLGVSGIIFKIQSNQTAAEETRNKAEIAARELERKITDGRQKLERADQAVSRNNFDAALQLISEVEQVFQGDENLLESDIQLRKNFIQNGKSLIAEMSKTNTANLIILEQLRQQMEASAVLPDMPQSLKNSAASLKTQADAVYLSAIASYPHLESHEISRGLEKARGLLNDSHFQSLSLFEQGKSRAALGNLLIRPGTFRNRTSSQEAFAAAAEDFRKAYENASNLEGKKAALWQKAFSEYNGDAYDASIATLTQFQREFSSSESDVVEADFLIVQNYILSGGYRDERYSKARDILSKYIKTENTGALNLRASTLMLEAYTIEISQVFATHQNLRVFEFRQLRALTGEKEALAQELVKLGDDLMKHFTAVQEQSEGQEIYPWFSPGRMLWAKQIVENPSNQTASPELQMAMRYLVVELLPNTTRTPTFSDFARARQEVNTFEGFYRGISDNSVKLAANRIGGNTLTHIRDYLRIIEKDPEIAANDASINPIIQSLPSDLQKGTILLAAGLHHFLTSYVGDRAQIQYRCLTPDPEEFETGKKYLQQAVEHLYGDKIFQKYSETLLMNDPIHGTGQSLGRAPHRFTPLIMEWNPEVLNDLLREKKKSPLPVIFLFRDASELNRMERDRKMLKDRGVYLIKWEQRLAKTKMFDLENLSGRIKAAIGLKELKLDQAAFLNDAYTEDWGRDVFRVKFNRRQFQDLEYRTTLLKAIENSLGGKDARNYWFNMQDDSNSYELILSRMTQAWTARQDFSRAA